MMKSLQRLPPNLPYRGQQLQGGAGTITCPVDAASTHAALIEAISDIALPLFRVLRAA